MNKTTLYAPKEILALDGFPVKQGKGRMSLAADARCRELAAQGYRIKGYVTNAQAAPNTTAPVVKKVAVSGEKVVEEYTILYPLESYKAVGEDGKTYTLREVCNTCRVSLVQNLCEHPTILGNISVKIVPQ